MQHNYVTMQDNYVNMRLKSCLHVYISNYPACLHNEVHINISMLHLDKIYLACKGQNYTIIDHSSCTDWFFSNIQSQNQQSVTEESTYNIHRQVYEKSGD